MTRREQHVWRTRPVQTKDRQSNSGLFALAEQLHWALSGTVICAASDNETPFDTSCFRLIYLSTCLIKTDHCALVTDLGHLEGDANLLSFIYLRLFLFPSTCSLRNYNNFGLSSRIGSYINQAEYNCYLLPTCHT